MVKSDLITIFGASGFVGRYVVRALAGDGHRIRAAMRQPQRAHFLRPMGRVGQIQLLQANIRDEVSSAAAIEGADIVINLVGIRSQTAHQKFAAVHGEAPGRLARQARAAGARAFIQMSAIGADPESPSKYARSKAAGETAVREAFPGAAIVRPSLIFGPEDDFFNMLGGLARLSPVLSVFGTARFQPVYVCDVAEVFRRLVRDAAPDGPVNGALIEAGGPRVYSFRELAKLVLDVTGRRNLLVPVPMPLAKLQGAVLGLLPNPMLTLDQVELLKQDNVVRPGPGITTLSDLGIAPHSAESILPTYLYRFRRRGQFEQIETA